MFAGILKKGAGIGPAFTFLYAGPAINILAIVYTANVLGLDLGIARGVLAVVSSILIGLIMAWIFREEERKELQKGVGGPRSDTAACEIGRPRWAVPLFFVLLLGILLVATSSLDVFIRLLIVYAFTLVIAVNLIYYFTRDEITIWGLETWDLTKKIFPLLIGGTFVLGMLAYFLPPESFRPFFGTNTITSCLLAALVGAILYMPTLLEVPIIGTTLGYLTGVMTKGPALSLLLSGPTISLPSLLVRIVGGKKTVIYAVLVVLFATIGGFLFGALGL
jgi:hypothetical protein